LQVRALDDVATHWIGLESPDRMTKPSSLKQILEFNERQLKAIEYNNIYDAKDQTLEDLQKEIFAIKRTNRKAALQ